MTPLRAIVLAIVATAVLAGCKGETAARRQVVRDHARLMADARALQARHGGSARDVEVPPSGWPRSIAALEPERVDVTPHGVNIQTHSFFVETAGIFVATEAGYTPPSRGEPWYEPIVPDVYWYYAPG